MPPPHIADLPPLARPRRVLVAGATGTLGRAVTTALLARGDDVVAVGRDRARLNAFADELGAKRVHPHVLDLARAGAADALAAIEPAVSDVVFAVGSFPATPLALVTHDDFARMVVDQCATFVTLVRAFAPSIAAARGAAVGFGEDGVERPYTNHIAYLAGKGALLAAMRALSLELSPAVRVGLVRVGVVTDPDVGDPVRGARLARRSRLGRTGTPSEVAHAALSMLDATWTSGEVWGVGG